MRAVRRTGKRKIPLAQEATDILSSLVTRPDFHWYYERDLDLRVRGTWARIGNAMRLALGESVTPFITYPDGHRADRAVHSDCRAEEYRDTIRRVRGTVMDTGLDEAKFRMSFNITGDPRQSIEALFNETSRSGREARERLGPS